METIGSFAGFKVQGLGSLGKLNPTCPAQEPSESRTTHATEATTTILFHRLELSTTTILNPEP